MSTTQIPPVSPAPPTRRPEGGELYDARYWESAYREINQAPTLLIKLQDDLTQAHRREAFWISVVVHLVVVLLIVNSQKLAGLLPKCHDTHDAKHLPKLLESLRIEHPCGLIIGPYGICCRSSLHAIAAPVQVIPPRHLQGWSLRYTPANRQQQSRDRRRFLPWTKSA